MRSVTLDEIIEVEPCTDEGYDYRDREVLKKLLRGKEEVTVFDVIATQLPKAKNPIEHKVWVLLTAAFFTPEERGELAIIFAKHVYHLWAKYDTDKTWWRWANGDKSVTREEAGAAAWAAWDAAWAPARDAAGAARDAAGAAEAAAWAAARAPAWAAARTVGVAARDAAGAAEAAAWAAARAAERKWQLGAIKKYAATKGKP